MMNIEHETGFILPLVHLEPKNCYLVWFSTLYVCHFKLFSCYVQCALLVYVFIMLYVNYSMSLSFLLAPNWA